MPTSLIDGFISVSDFRQISWVHIQANSLHLGFAYDAGSVALSHRFQRPGTPQMSERIPLCKPALCPLDLTWRKRPKTGATLRPAAVTPGGEALIHSPASSRVPWAGGWGEQAPATPFQNPLSHMICCICLFLTTLDADTAHLIDFDLVDDTTALRLRPRLMGPAS